MMLEEPWHVILTLQTAVLAVKRKKIRCLLLIEFVASITIREGVQVRSKQRVIVDNYCIFLRQINS